MCASADGTISIWLGVDAASLVALNVVCQANKNMGTACSVGKEEKVSAVGWSAANRRCVVRRAPILDIAVHPSGRALLSVGKDRRLRMWNLVTATEIYKQKFDSG
jgi:hypothetical protein